jgi:hypothetical protein
MPTIDINTQRSSGGIGNAWDFFDIQRVLSASDRVTLARGRHTLQAGVEYRHVNIAGEFMSRTNGDLDYNNWVLFFTGHGAASGSSDLDQGDTRRDFRAHDIGGFVQDDWRLGGGLTLNVGLRYDLFGDFADRNGRIGNYYLPDAAAQLGVQPGFQVPANAPFFQPGFTPLSIGLVVDPGTPIDLSQIHVAMNDSTLAGDRNNVAPRVGFAWQPGFAPQGRRARRLGHVLRAAGGELQSRPPADRAVLHLPERPRATRYGRPVSAAQREPVPDSPERRDRPRRQRRAEVGAGRRLGVSRAVAVQREEQRVHRSVGPDALHAPVVGERPVRAQSVAAVRRALRGITRASVCSERSTWRCRSIRA